MAHPTDLLPLHKRRKKPRTFEPNSHYSLAETQLQERVVEELILKCVPTSQWRVMANAILTKENARTISIHRIQKLSKRIQQRWQEDDKRNSTSLRTKAVRRIESAIARAESELKDQPRALHQTHARYYTLLSHIQGTQAPIQIDVQHTVSVTVQALIAQMSPEQIQQKLDAHAETERLAQLARKSA